MAEKKKSLFGTPFIILTFVLVFFVLFNEGLRNATARIAGYALTPAIGFGGRAPLLTVFLASVVLVIATTAIRHFLTDWTKLARMQEAMRAFGKEMKEARKSNNTYKLKKLTEAQQDLMALQADAQTEQMKPMALTMLIVIPIFAWLGAWLAVPIFFAADDPPVGSYALIGMEEGDLAYATIVDQDRSSFSTNDGALVHALDLDGTGATSALTFTPELRGDPVSIPTAGAPDLPVGASLGAIDAGAHTFRIDHGDLALATVDSAAGEREVDSLVLIVHEGNEWDVHLIFRDDITISTGDAELFAIVPANVAGTTLRGSASVVVDGTRAIPLSDANLVALSAPGVDVEPIPVAAPWNHAWDIMDGYTWITGNPGWFPRWIVLYSLFGIPFGQIAQRALKLWEYRHVDLDGDGKPAGEA